MHVIYDPSQDSRSGWKDRTDPLIEWCASEGMDANNIWNDAFVIVRDDSGDLKVLYREFVRHEFGGRVLDQYEVDEPDESGSRMRSNGYVKTGWLVKRVTTLPAFVEGAA